MPDTSAVAQASYRRRYGFANQCSVGLGTFGHVAVPGIHLWNAKKADAIAHARLVCGLPLTMTRALGILA